MTLLLKLIANPLVTKLVGKVIGKVFDRKSEDYPVNPKVAAIVGTGGFVTVALLVIGFFYPGLDDVLVGANVAAVVVGIATVVNAVVGYFTPDE